MSHNVSMSGIPLKDFDTLRLALNELNREHGMKFELEVGNVASRNYSLDRSTKQTRVVEGTVAVIKCGNLSFDISITKKNGEYGIEAEALLIEPLRHALKVPNNPKDLALKEDVDVSRTGYGRNEALGLRAAIGPIVQRYSVITAEKQAAMQGHSVKRVVDRKTGVISLHATVN